MPAKSQIRKSAEQVLSTYGIDKGYNVFTDTHTTRKRVKFAFVVPCDAMIARMRRDFAAMFPEQQTMVEVSGKYKSQHHCGHNGIAFTVFNG